MAPREEIIERRTIAVLVDNEPGVLARVIGLFSGRGYNIESLTVTEVDPTESLSRITIVTSGTPQVLEQIKAQLDRLVPVHWVSDLTLEGPHVERELALVKVAGSGEKRVEGGPADRPADASWGHFASMLGSGKSDALSAPPNQPSGRSGIAQVGLGPVLPRAYRPSGITIRNPGAN